MFRITPIRSATLAAVAALLAVAAPAGANVDNAVANFGDTPGLGGGDMAAHNLLVGEDILPPYLRSAPFSSLPEVGDEVLVMQRRPDGIIGILIGL